MDNASVHTEYWNSFFEKRISGNFHLRNAEKFNLVMGELWRRPYLAPLRKLDVGCGSGIHAMQLGAFNPEWKDAWVGLDLSDKAVSVARNAGLDAVKSDFFGYSASGKFGAFLFLDSLEHVMTRGGTAEKIRELAAKKFMVLGNAPLYLTDHGADVEVGVSKPILSRLAKGCGCGFIRFHVYGVKGYPYVFFEFHNYDSPEPWIGSIPWGCVPSGGWERVDA